VTDAAFSRPARARVRRAARLPKLPTLPTLPTLPAVRLPLGAVRPVRDYRATTSVVVVLMAVSRIAMTSALAIVLQSARPAIGAASPPPAAAGLTGAPVAAQLPAAVSPSPAPSASPRVFRRVRHLVAPTLLVSAATPFSAAQLRALRAVPGVRRTQPLLAGRVAIAGHRAFAVGVEPLTFRVWTPKLTADSPPLWNTIDNGDLVTSFDMGENAQLPLGASLAVASRVGVTPMRLGALASIGMAGVDAVVSGSRARQLGLRSNTGLLISAPRANPLTLRRAVAHAIRGHGHIDLLHEVVITRDAGEFLTRVQIATFLRAAASRVGLPYVWGATGPKAFDCSGLV
jgi:peptidoglycan DL-endopeptidase CwlO